jgi:hypothetical protein
MIKHNIIYLFLALSLVIFSIVFLWYILWKYVLEPNPLIRDFFDLDDNKKIIKQK